MPLNKETQTRKTTSQQLICRWLKHIARSPFGWQLLMIEEGILEAIEGPKWFTTLHVSPLMTRRVVGKTRSNQYMIVPTVFQLLLWQTSTLLYSILKVVGGSGWGPIVLKYQNSKSFILCKQMINIKQNN